MHGLNATNGRVMNGSDSEDERMMVLKQTTLDDRRSEQLGLDVRRSSFEERNSTDWGDGHLARNR